ncbi:toxin protein [Yersinia pseudotuberculosis]|nr:toxin protein [Yersinia pseudotuberculosis]
MKTSLFSKTPPVTVLDNRGLTVRDIAYHRHPDSPDVISERITHHQYDARADTERRPAPAWCRADELQLPDGPDRPHPAHAGGG